MAGRLSTLGEAPMDTDLDFEGGAIAEDPLLWARPSSPKSDSAQMMFGRYVKKYGQEYKGKNYPAVLTLVSRWCREVETSRPDGETFASTLRNELSEQVDDSGLLNIVIANWPSYSPPKKSEKRGGH